MGFDHEKLDVYKVSVELIILIDEIVENLYTNNFKNWFLTLRKMSRFNDHKLLHINNMEELVIVKSRRFLFVKTPILEVVCVYHGVELILQINCREQGPLSL